MASGIQNLELFVRAALEKGLPKPEIEQCLQQAGWPADQIKNALGQFADIAFAVPVPKPRPYLSAREAFHYLLLFTTLYLSAYHLGSLLFSFVNLIFPDPVAQGRSWRTEEDSIRLAVSFLVIAFPVFLFMSRRIQREQTRNPVKRHSVIRRWLTYLTLFAAAGFVIGDLVTLVFYALGGELTVRFFLKVLIVGMIAGTIFGFYLWDLRREECEE
jgi:MFS family permease